MAPDRCGWTLGWTEISNRSYWSREAQVQADMDKPVPGHWCNIRVGNLHTAQAVSRNGELALLVGDKFQVIQHAL